MIPAAILRDIRERDAQARAGQKSGRKRMSPAQLDRADLLAELDRVIAALVRRERALEQIAAITMPSVAAEAVADVLVANHG